MRGALLAAALAGTTYIPSAHAYFRTGNDLYVDCRDDGTICVNYLIGFLDMDRTRGGGYFCIPPEATVRQIKDVVMTQLDERPQERHQPFALLATGALIAAFPCR